MTNGHITIKYQGRVWSAKATPAGRIFVTANNGASADVHESEATAHAWLGNHGLRRGRIRRLLDAALRGTGDYADENHPNRVKENGCRTAPKFRLKRDADSGAKTESVGNAIILTGIGSHVADQRETVNARPNKNGLVRSELSGG